MRAVRIGVIGTGGMGSGHCRSMSRVREARLTAVCDVRQDTVDAVSKEHGVPGFTQARDLLDSGLVEAVIIATPHYDHPPIAIEAFRRGIHVLCEKPIAVTVSAADEMIREAAQSECRFGVMYQMRSLKRSLAARTIVEEGGLGEIYRTLLVMGWFRNQAYYDSGGWRATWAGEGGGVLINQAPHLLDLFTWLGGMPVQLLGRTRTRLHDIEVEDEATAMLEYPNGAHGYLYTSTTEAPGHEMMEICGDRGKLVIQGSSVRYFRMESPIREFSREAEDMWSGPGSEAIDPTEFKITTRQSAVPGRSPAAIAADRLARSGGEGGHHMDIVRNFCRSIRFDEPLLAPGAEGLKAVELINGVILSGQTGKPVKLPIDRQGYDRLIAKLQKSSRAKSSVREQIATDPQHTSQEISGREP